MPVFNECLKANTDFDSTIDHSRVEPKSRSKYYDFVEKYFDTSRLTDNMMSESYRRMTATHRRQSLLGELAAVAPEQLRRLDAWLANNFDMNHFVRETGAGNLRYNLLANKTTAENVLNVLARTAENQKLRKVLKNAKRVAGRHGFKSNKAFSELFRELIEVGQIPLRTKSTKIGDNVSSVFSPYSLEHKFNAKRFNDFQGRLKASGFSDAEIKEMLTLSAEYSNTVKAIRDGAKSFRVETGPDLTGGTGYFTRILTPEAQAYFRKLKRQGFEDVPDLDILTGNRVKMKSFFSKMRSTQIPVPKVASDIAAAAIWNASKRGDATSLLKTAEFPNVQALDDHMSNLLLNDPIAYVRFLNEKVDPQVIDNLVNEGIMQQIPMTSSEVADYWAEVYKLPNGVKYNLFETDPAKVIQEYANDLGRSAGKNEMFNHVINEGIREGWSIPAETFKSWQRKGFPDGVSESDFTNLSSTQLWQRANIDTTNLPLRDVWVNKAAAEVFVGLIKMQSSPVQMSNLMGGLSRLFQLRSTSILLGQHFKYVFRVMVGNGASAFAATGYHPMSVVAMTSRNTQVASAIGRRNGFANVFDNVDVVTKIGDKEYTAKTLVEGIYALRNTDGIPLTALNDTATFTSFDGAFNNVIRNPVETARRVFEYATWSADPSKVTRGLSFGTIKDGLEYLFGVSYEQAIDKLFAPLAFAANMSDIGTRMAIIELMPKGRFKSLEEALRYTDQYIPRPDSGGAFTRSVSKWFGPFSRYMMYSMGSSVRHAYRYPNRYMAINKGASFFNDARQMEGGCQTPQAGVEPWMRSQYGIVVGCTNGSVPELNNPIVLYSNNYDPIVDGMSRVGGAINVMSRMLGTSDPSNPEERDDLSGRSDPLRDAASGILSGSHWGPLFEAISGTDLFTGRDLTETELVGNVRIPGRTMALLEGVMPLLRDPIRMARTDELQTDVYGNRTYGKRPQPLPQLAALGLSIREHDVARNLQFSITDAEFDRKALSTAIKDLMVERNELARVGRSFEHIDNEVRRLAQAEFILAVDEARIRHYATQRGVPTRQAIQEVNEAYEALGAAATHTLPNPQVGAYNEAYDKYKSRLSGVRGE